MIARRIGAILERLVFPPTTTASGTLMHGLDPRVDTDPDPILVGVVWPDGATLEAMHLDCIILLESSDPEDRLQALGRLLPYTARGMDLAGMLGFVEP